MSRFASLSKSDPIPLPGDDGHTIIVRKLTGREYELVCEEHRSGLWRGRATSWPALFKRALREGAKDPAVLTAIADPLMGHDRYAILRHGLVSWTLPQSLTPIAAQPAVEGKDGQPGTPAVEAYDALDDLDDDTVDFIATEILKRTKPALFVTTVEEVEDDQKKGSSGSTAG
jgi:hypothetical protein